jgi:hypothetical protein
LIPERAPAVKPDRTRPKEPTDAVRKHKPAEFSTPLPEFGAGRGVSDPADWEGKVKPARKLTKNAGGRWKLLAIRGTVYSVLGLMLLLGSIRLINPNPVNIDKITQQVSSSLGRNGFPMETGQEMASRFTVTYLTFDFARMGARNTALSAFSNGSVSDWGTDSVPSFPQKVVAGPFLATTPDLIDPTHVTYTFTAQVTVPKSKADDSGLKWVYLEVPMTADGAAVAVAGKPAFVSQPATAAFKPTKINLDKKANDDANMKSKVNQFLSDWVSGKSSTTLSSDATYAAHHGPTEILSLAGDATSNLKIYVEAPASKADTRYNAYVQVTWQLTGGGHLQQRYRLTLDQSADGYWSVYDIKGGNFVDFN